MSAAAPARQQAGELLGGYSQAVAYSGFRHGQHPDRGDGAVNPSAKEVLEDLNILSRQCHFGLIRVYDSRPPDIGSRILHFSGRFLVI
jgi:hypothetical protein